MSILDRRKTVCILGFGADTPVDLEQLEKAMVRLQEQIERSVDEGYRNFIYGDSNGFDTIAATRDFWADSARTLHGKLIRVVTSDAYYTPSLELSTTPDEERVRKMYAQLRKDAWRNSEMSIVLRGHSAASLEDFLVSNSHRLICYFATEQVRGNQFLRRALEEKLDVLWLYDKGRRPAATELRRDVRFIPV